jgi:hypothetical protein
LTQRSLNFGYWPATQRLPQEVLRPMGWPKSGVVAQRKWRIADDKGADQRGVLGSQHDGDFATQ